MTDDTSDARIDTLLRGGDPDKIDRELARIEKEAEQSIVKLQTQLKKGQRAMRRRAAMVVFAGGIAGVALIWISGQTHDFLSRLTDGLGAGLLVAASVAAVTPFVAGLWNRYSLASSESMADSLGSIHSDITKMSATVAYRSRELATFLMDWRDEEHAAK